MDNGSYDSWDGDLDQIEGEASGQGLQKALGLLRGRWHWAILLGVALGGTCGYFAFNFQEDLYETESGVTVKLNDGAVTSNIEQLSDQYFAEVEMQIRKMESAEIIQAAMSTSQWQEHLASRPEDAPVVTIDDFREALEIEPPGRNSRFITISYEDEVPETASAGVNSLMRAYKQFRDQEDRDDNRLDREALTGKLRELENREASLRNNIARILPEADALTLETRLQQKLNELNMAELELQAIDIRLEPLVDSDGNPTPELQKRLKTEDPEMAALLARKANLEEELRTLLEIRQLGESNRVVQRMMRQISAVDADIAALEETYTGTDEEEVVLPPAIADLVVQRRARLSTVNTLRARVDDLAQKLASIERINREIELVESQIVSTRAEISQYDTWETERDTVNRTRIELGPMTAVPQQPSNQTARQQMGALGGLGGLAAGFGLVMLYGLLDRRFRYVADAAADMPSLNVLGMLPTLPAKMNDPEEAEAAAHCVHHIRTLLQIGGTNRVFSITSPTAGSGKSSLTSALGMSFASSGTKTLVIDCDLVGAGLSRRLGVVVHQPLEMVIRKHKMLDQESLDRALMASTTSGRPLADVLADQGIMTEDELEKAGRLQRDTSLGLLDATTPGRMRACVAETEMPGLFVLPVGKAKPADASKLSPTAVRALIQQARESYDLVLIDTGPALGSLEASIAAAESDATVLVVSRGDGKGVTRRCVQLLNSVHANIAGVVFNHALDKDLAHTSYASAVSQDRRPDRDSRRARAADMRRVARFGPLGSAVAAYQDERSDSTENDESFHLSSSGTNGTH